MLEHLKQFFTKLSETKAFTQQEKEALIELLLIIKYADKTLAAEETEYLVALQAHIGWNSPVQYDNFIGTVTAKIRSLSNEKLVNERVEYLVAKIDTPSLTPTIQFSEDLAKADGEFSDSEKAIVAKIKELAAKR